MYMYSIYNVLFQVPSFKLSYTVHVHVIIEHANTVYKHR